MADSSLNQFLFQSQLHFANLKSKLFNKEGRKTKVLFVFFQIMYDAIDLLVNKLDPSSIVDLSLYFCWIYWDCSVLAVLLEASENPVRKAVLSLAWWFFLLGIIKNGGVKPNIIPSKAELEFYLRAPSLRELAILTEKAENCFKAAALATGCEVGS